MRLRFDSSALFLSLVLALTGSVGCMRELKLMGATCTSNDDCNSDFCGPNGVCTQVCTAQTACPEGFDCTQLSNDAKERTCNKVQYPLVTSGGFGTPCAAVACSGAPTPCNEGEGFFCYNLDAEKCSARQECTRGCESDLDCPHNYFCGEHTVRTKGEDVKTKACLKNMRCSECFADDECPRGFRCADDNVGGRFCAKPCNIDDDCLDGTPRAGGGTFDPFEFCRPAKVRNADGEESEANVCTPETGACHGKSPITSVTENGGMCSPCRFGTPSDCQEGFDCFIDSFDGEFYCSPKCTATLKKNAMNQWEQTDIGDCGEGFGCIVRELGSTCTSSATTCKGNGRCTADAPRLRGFSCY